MEINHTESLSPHSNESALFNLYKLGAGAAAILSVLIGIVLFHYHMSSSRYFASTSATGVSLLLLAMNIGFAFTSVFLFKKGVSETSDRFPVIRYIFLLPAVSAVASALALLMLSPLNAMTLATSLLALISAAYMACIALGAPKTVTLILGYCHVFFLILILSMLYLDFTVELNAPMKLFIQFTAMAAILSTLSDLRIAIGRASVGFYSFSQISFMVLSLFTSVGAIVEAIPHFSDYGAAYAVLPLYFLSLAVPCSTRFFCTVLHAKASPRE